MDKLREHIRKEIKRISEELGMKKYPTPPEIMNALVNDLRLRPAIRYVNNVKAANTVPPSYMIFLHNGQSFQLYIEKTSIVAKIGTKSYWLMNGDETSEARKELNRLLTQPIPSSGEEDTGETTGDEGGEAGGEAGGGEAEMELDEGGEGVDTSGAGLWN